MRLDLPALGMPSSPTSASTINSSSRVRLLARRTVGKLARRAIGAALEVDVAQAVVAALGHQQTLSVGQHLADHLFGIHVLDPGTHRDPHQQILALAPGHLAPHAVLAPLGTMVTGVTEIHQGVQSLVTHQVDAAAVAAVTAVGTTLGDVFFTAKLAAPLPPSPASTSFVYEFHNGLRIRLKNN